MSIKLYNETMQYVVVITGKKSTRIEYFNNYEQALELIEWIVNVTQGQKKIKIN